MLHVFYHLLGATFLTRCLEGTMTRKFDLIAIGTGSAASGVTSRCREAGWKVAIVDSRPFGGTCALRGCDPKKVLVGAAEAVDWTRRMKGKGIHAAELQIDWPELMRFKRSFTESVAKRREDDFAKAGIAAFHGRARFAGPTTLGKPSEAKLPWHSVGCLHGPAAGCCRLQ
jgi:glutathione reductase (NADPH)